jgi:WD40 repeat protein
MLVLQAVSGDQAGTISVWCVMTGKLRFRFSNTHPGQQLTALSFDSAKRRLITGTTGVQGYTERYEP